MRPPLARKSASTFALFLAVLLVAAAVVSLMTVPASAQGGNATATNSTSASAGSNASGNSSSGSGGASASGNSTGGSSGGGESRTFTIAAQEDASKCPDGNAPCWDVPLMVVAPGDNVTINVDLTKATVPHDFHVSLPSGEIKVPNTPSLGQVYPISFTFPANVNKVSFFCSVHPKTMVGSIGIASAIAAPPAEGSNVPDLGVHFLSYWVGIIAFMLLFLVYGVTFFLFKYNETSATTDQWERTGAGAPEFQRRFSPGAASLLALLFAAILIAVVILLARR